MGYAVAEAVRDALSAAGGAPTLMRGPGDDPTPSDRARAANISGAAACVSIHLRVQAAEPGGPTCSYFGNAATHSPAGMLLATSILEELEREFRCSGRLQRLTVAMLRETRMPAVQVEPTFGGGVTPDTAADPRFPERVGAAVARGVQRFLDA